ICVHRNDGRALCQRSSRREGVCRGGSNPVREDEGTRLEKSQNLIAYFSAVSSNAPSLLKRMCSCRVANQCVGVQSSGRGVESTIRRWVAVLNPEFFRIAR